MLISLKALSAAGVWHRSFLKLLMPRRGAAGSVLAELTSFCNSLSLPKKKPPFFLLGHCTQPGACEQAGSVNAEQVLGEA